MLLTQADTQASRALLFSRIADESILNHIPANIRTLYDLLEKPSSPLRLRAKCTPLLAALEADPLLSIYVPALRELVAVRVLQRLSTMYTVVTVDHLMSLLPETYDWAAAERLILSLVSTTSTAAASSISAASLAALSAATALQIRIDHRDKVIYFFADSFDAPDMTQQLATLASALSRVTERITPAAELAAIREDERKSVFAHIRTGAAGEQEIIEQRRAALIQRRDRERIEAEVKEAERQAKAIADRASREAAERERQEAKEREIASEERRREQEERENARKKMVAETIAKTMADLPSQMQDFKAAKRVANMAQNLDSVKQEELIEASRKLQLQQKQERERRLLEERKQLDYFQRAVRLQVCPHLCTISHMSLSSLTH